MKNYVLFSIIATLIHILGFYYFGCLRVLVFNIRDSNNCFIMTFVAGITIAAQRLIIYIFLMKRLKITFENSIYKLSNISYYFIIIALVFCFFTIQAINLYSSYQIKSYKCGDQPGSNIFKITLVIGGVLDIFWAIIITFMFVSKLKALLKLNERKNNKIEAIMMKLTLLSMYRFIFCLLVS